jgi:Fe-Mn family superoxide dismutase
MHALPDLPYAHDALEPYIDFRTMEIHHGKHHQAYVNNLNAALADYPDLQDLTLENLLRQIDTVPEAIRTAVRNNGGGHSNHSLFWLSLSPGGGGEPTGDLGAAIESTFGSLDDLRSQLHSAAMTRFGSGWGWLVAASGGLAVYSTPNQDSPYMSGDVPLLGVDVWEHAYYLKYQNRRAEYLDEWWRIVNWDAVAGRYAAAC